MKQVLTLILCILVIQSTFSQVNGTYTIGTAPFTNLSTAIAELNQQGTTTGVTFLVPAGYTEFFTDALEGHITATGSASAPIVFMKSGSGNNPVITAGAGTGSFLME